MITPKIIKREYKSGFKAEIILKPHFYQRFFGIIIDFGSSDPQKVAGSAHFLEHKLFAKKMAIFLHNLKRLGLMSMHLPHLMKQCFIAVGLNIRLR